MKAIPLVIATVIMLTGCGMADSETVVPGVVQDASEINFGLIPGGLPAGFYDDAEEPAGWSLPLLPTNVYSTTGATTESGELLGWPIEVRFTPVAYRWSWGDGSQSVTTEPGSSWGSKQFSDTGTSHVYEISGDYVVSLEVTFEAAYRFDGGAFQSLPGQITRSGGQRVVDVLSVTSVLVDRGCHSETLVSGRC